MKRKLGIITTCLPGVAEIDTLEKIKGAGFDMIFADTFDVKTACAMKDKCERLGISFDFLHAPFAHINDYWENGDAYLGIRDGMMKSIDSASAAGIPLIVAHTSSGWQPPKISEIGFTRFDELVDYAISKGVKIAFENLRVYEYLAVVLDRYKNVPEVGYCYDCGHEHCYTETVKFLDLYGDRLLCTHIHDNFGRDKQDVWKDADYHLLPFEGNIDYKDMMARIKKTGYTGALTLEVHKKGEHMAESDEEFLKNAYERIKKISEM